MSDVFAHGVRAGRAIAHHLCVLIFSLSALVCGSAFSSPLSNYFQESWTTRDGLPHNTINSINQSEDGYLWLGTWEGAARFNGRKFDIFGRGELTGLPDSGIRSIRKDQRGNLLFAGSRGGFSRLGKQGWDKWPALNVLLNAAAEDARGSIWLASEGQGLYRQSVDGARQQYTAADGLPSDVVQSLLVDDKGRLWIGTGKGLVWLDTNSAQVKFNLLNDLPALPVFSLQTFQDQILIGTERGLYRYQNGNVTLFSPELNNLPVSAIFVQQQDIWLGTTDRGLLRYSAAGVETLTMSGGLPNNRILALHMDREGSMWVGTNGGLFRLRDAPFVTYTQEQGLVGDYVRAVLPRADGSVWLGTSLGVSRFSDSGIETIDVSVASKGQSILSLVEDGRGGVWIGTFTDGALYYENGRVTKQYNRKSGLLSNEIRAILPEPAGGLWLGTAQGLNYIAADGRISSFTKADGLPTPFILALYQHNDGRLFIGTGGGVAVRYPDGNISALDFSGLENAEYAFGFAPDILSDVLWISTDRGLVAYNLTNTDMQILGRSHGLPFDKVFQAVVDKEHNIWLSGNRGIVRLERQVLNQALQNTNSVVRFELFGESDGMQSAQANGGSMQAAAMASDGSIWFAMSKGASRVQPSELKRFASHTPPVIIESLQVNGKPVALSKDLVLPAGVNRLELRFAGLGFIMPQRIQYSSRLSGFDHDWVERGNNTSAEYTNLAPGRYHFAVRAAYPQGDWSVQDAELTFVIQPYYWQRNVFWFAVMVLALLMFGLLIRWRLTSLKRRELMLRNQVAEKTLELQRQADHLTAVDKERSALLLQIQQQAQMFELQARLDSLTGLANRRAFDEALLRECARARRTHHPLCLVLLDIDHFKQVNDKYSHSAGDEILKRVANLISSLCRQDDTVARWGGEEFALLLPNTTMALAQDICERLRLAITQIDCTDLDPELIVTASLGIAAFGGELQHEKLLSRSDSALYKAKQNGRNRVVVAA
ncbi:MAG TPA: diguanylate cyclase [Rheinheimera sp.]|nr:diguanylate cyclase [Rheinheimera sp.]